MCPLALNGARPCPAALAGPMGYCDGKDQSELNPNQSAQLLGSSIPGVRKINVTEEPESYGNIAAKSLNLTGAVAG